ncbi:hypothetical protein [uncultured Piscinibacter sp.]|uniref:hypothetical protein n=1 Tax=uncultured Piscinibacter sp. TaxID=1131835 RepID=UPI0026313C9E|nr:hypothetical protein [uncultured Piscinibacter sp.]
MNGSPATTARVHVDADALSDLIQYVTRIGDEHDRPGRARVRMMLRALDQTPLPQPDSRSDAERRGLAATMVAVDARALAELDAARMSAADHRVRMAAAAVVATARPLPAVLPRKGDEVAA